MTNLDSIKNQMLEYSENNPDYSKRALILDTFDNVVKSYENRKCLNCEKFSICNYIGCFVGLQSKEEMIHFCCNEWEELL